MNKPEQKSSEIILLQLLSVVWSKKVVILVIGVAAAFLGSIYEMTRPSVAKVSVTFAPADISRTVEVKTFNNSVSEMARPSMLWAYGDMFGEYPKEIAHLNLILPGIGKDEFKRHFETILADMDGIETFWNSIVTDNAAGSDYSYLMIPSVGSARLLVTGPKADTAEQLARDLVGEISEDVRERALMQIDSEVALGTAQLDEYISLLKQIRDLHKEVSRSTWTEILEAQERLLASAEPQAGTEQDASATTRSILAFMTILEGIHADKKMGLQTVFIANEIARLEAIDIPGDVRDLLAETPLASDTKLSVARITQVTRQSARFPLSMSLLAGLAGLFIALSYVVFGHFIRRPMS